MLPQVCIWTDGSFNRNTSRGGYSALLLYGNQPLCIWGEDYNTTISRMELSAVIAGLSRLNTPCSIQIYADSMYVVNGINKWLSGWLLNNFLTANGQPVVNQDLWQALAKLMQIHQVSAFHVKSHTNQTDFNSVANNLVDHFAYHGAALDNFSTPAIC